MPGCAVALESATFDTSDGRHRAVNTCHCHIILPIFVRSFILLLSWFGLVHSILVLYITLTAWPRARREECSPLSFIFHSRALLRLKPYAVTNPSCAIGATRAHRSLRLHIPHTHTHTHSLSLPPLPAVARLTTANPPPRTHQHLNYLPYRTLTQTLRLRFNRSSQKPSTTCFSDLC